MTEYRTYRFVDGKVRQVIVDENGKIVNRRPSKDELKGLDIEPYKHGNSKPRPWMCYTDKELLDSLRRFVKEYGRIPVMTDFVNNPEYPSFRPYQLRFGSWNKALKLVEMDLDTRVMQGFLTTEIEKGRYAEIKVINHFKQHPIDLAGENNKNPCDGICPNGKTYDVKSSKLHEYEDALFWNFGTNNKYKEDIEIYYFLAFNKDYSKLKYGWRVPGEIVDKDNFYVGLNPGCEFDVEDMDKYDITDRFKDIMNI